MSRKLLYALFNAVAFYAVMTYDNQSFIPQVYNFAFFAHVIICLAFGSCIAFFITGKKRAA